MFHPNARHGGDPSRCGWVKIDRMRASTSRSLIIATLVCTTALTIAGCAPTAPEPSATPTDSAPSATPTPTETEPAATEDTPVEIECSTLVSDQVIYDFNPNFGAQPDFTPAPGSDPETILGREGVACEWVNGTSGETMIVAVANLPTSELDALKNDLIMTSNPVPTYGVEGYFQVTAGVGEAVAFSGPYWIVGESTAFFEPGDASTIMEAAIAALG